MSEGIAPKLCCDRKQLIEMQKFKYILDNVIGRCPSCYYNLLGIFCEMACSPDQDRFLWPLETMNITVGSEYKDDQLDGDVPIRKDWGIPDYVDPDEETENSNENAQNSTAVVQESFEVIKKLRYFISDKQANDFIESCW